MEDAASSRREDARRQTESLAFLEHRPWPLPRSPWLMGQTWKHLVFAHWRVDAELLRAAVPAPLELLLHEGSAWVGVSPFVICGLHGHGLPPPRRLSAIHEVNVRTYVALDGRPGILFFSLDAGSRLAVAAARLVYRLPYHRATMELDVAGGWVDHRSERPGFRVHVRAAPRGPGWAAAPGSLEAFLIEHYCLYAVGRRMLLRAEIHHRPWTLHLPHADTVVDVEGRFPVDACRGEPLVHVASPQDAVIWPAVPVARLRRAAGDPRGRGRT